MLSKEKLLAYARKSGIDLVAVAPAERFAAVEPQRSPLTIFPEARSILICAREIPRGTFRGIEEGTLWTRAGRFIEAIHIYALARCLENEGAIAVPCSPLSGERWPEGVPFRDGKIEPNVYPELDYAVVACGLGEIGYCGLPLTPQFGTRQALGMIITDLEIETDPVFAGKVCDRENCAQCAAACPMAAIEPDQAQERTICGKTFTVAGVNRLKCRYCPNGTFPDTTHAEAMPNRLTAACGRACLAHLDASGTLEHQYKTPFRRREAWGFDLHNL